MRPADHFHGCVTNWLHFTDEADSRTDPAKYPAPDGSSEDADPKDCAPRQIDPVPSGGVLCLLGTCISLFVHVTLRMQCVCVCVCVCVCGWVAVCGWICVCVAL